MIIELVLEHKQVAFYCNTLIEFRELVDYATSEMEFEKQGFPESREYILNNYIEHIGKDKCYGLICAPHVSPKFEFYSRSYYENYEDWKFYKKIDFSFIMRKYKLKKLSNIK